MTKPRYAAVLLLCALLCRLALGQNDDWNTPLQEASTGATRVVVRSGGTCHQDPETEKTLAEIQDAEGVRELLASIEIVSDDSGFHCMCCGNPTIEIYAAETLLVSLGYHHGRSLRWVEGWEGDGLLTEASAAKLAAWMTAQGIEGPAKELAEGKSQETAAALRAERQLAVIPPAALDALQNAENEQEAAAAFLTLGEPGIRAAFAVLGCHRGPWNTSDNFEDFLEEWVLDEMDDALLASVLRDLQPRTPEARGCARYLFAGRKTLQRVGSEVVDEAVPALSSDVLRDAPAINRRVTLLALGKLGTPRALEQLRAVLTDGMPRTEPEDPASEGSTWVTSGPGWGELKKAASDLTIAAEALAQADDRQSLPLLERLLKTTPEQDRERVAAAVAKLREGP